MREIKFAGKRLDNGEWAISSYPYGTMISDTMIHDFDKKTISQYTGLKDRNGYEIYENDIIRNVETGKVAKIVYFPENAAFMISWHDKLGAYIDYLGDCNLSKCVRIGNIFDNSDLF